MIQVNGRVQVLPYSAMSYLRRDKAMKTHAIHRNLLIPAATLFALVVLGGPLQAQTWRNQTDGSAPNVGDVSDCRLEGRRQAEQMYPILPPPGLPQGATTYGDSERRSQMENSVFERCMRSKGFEKVEQK